MAGETILLVDDEDACLKRMRDILQQEGYTVLEAMDYASAVAVFENYRNAIHLLVSDVSLPGRNGCEIFKTLGELDPNLPVLFISGHVGAEVCRLYGVDVTDRHFLRKPFEAAEFAARVQQLSRTAGPFPATSACQA